MAHEVKMPQMGESIAEGTITTWLKKVGDRVERDAPLFEIATDKVDAEIPAPASGILLEIRAQPGDTVPIGSIVAVIETDGAGAVPTPAASKAPEPSRTPAAVPPAPAAVPAPAAAPAYAAPQPVPAAAAQPVATQPAVGRPAPAPLAAQGAERGTKSSPLVRKIAAEHDVDVSALHGTGLSGRVTKQDIMQHLEGRSAAPVAETQVVVDTGRSGASPPPPLLASGTGGELVVPENLRPRLLAGDRVEDLSIMRLKIAEHMVLSKRISPHVGTVWEMDFSRIAAFRAKYKGIWAERHGVNLTYNAFILRAAVNALKAFPMVNASIDGKRLIYHAQVNLGIAVALDQGLLVPVVHGADELNLLGLTRRAGDLAQRARTKKLKLEEMQGGTFTVTNPGNLGAMFNIPVINQPQVAILGVGTVEKRPVVIDDAIAIRTRAYLSLSFDHRALDGAVADQFMAKVKEGIEKFDAAEL